MFSSGAVLIINVKIFFISLIFSNVPCFLIFPGTHRIVVTVPLILALVGFMLPWPHHFSWPLGARLHFANRVHPVFLISLFPTLIFFFYSILLAAFSKFLEGLFSTRVSIFFSMFYFIQSFGESISCS